MRSMPSKLLADCQRLIDAANRLIAAAGMTKQERVLQPIVKKLLNTERCPVSEKLSERIFSLPMHTQLHDEDVSNIIRAVEKVSTHFSR